MNDTQSERPTQQAESIPPRRPHVVILGAGFGGLNAAQGLRRAPVDVTVVDRRN
jgi:NADH dehydrogenase